MRCRDLLELRAKRGNGVRSHDPVPVDGEQRVLAVPDLDVDVDWRDHLLAASVLDLASHPDARVRGAADDLIRRAAEVAASGAAVA